MKHVALALAIVALLGGCIFGGHTKDNTAKPSTQAEGQTGTTETTNTTGGSEKPETKPEVPKPKIPVADEATQKKIDAAIAKFKDTSAKPEERQDALLKDLVAIGPIATVDVLKLVTETSTEPRAMMAQKFFELLQEKDKKACNEALLLQLYNDDASLRTAANQMLVQLTGKKDIGYDANADEAARAEAIKKWAKELGLPEPK